MPYEQMTLILLLLGIIAARGDNNKNDCTGIKEDFPHLKQCEQKCTPSTMSCVEVNGRWKCLVNTCPPLSDPVNGEVTVAGLEAGSGAAFYSCQPGFELTGVSLRTCDDDGVWTDAEPVCTQIECVPPEVPINGHVEISGTVYDSEVRYNCDYGYTLSGPELRLCNGHGQWSGTDPVCVKVCGGELSDKEGNFTSPYYQAGQPSCSLGYPENFTCTWTIRAPTDNVVYVKLGRYYLGSYGDKVYLYDGPDTESTLLRILTGYGYNQYIISTGTTMTVVFESDAYDDLSSKGFSALYRIVDDPALCGGVITDVPRHVTSPGYPWIYPRNVNCTWLITVNESMVVNMTFTYFNTYYGDLRIYNGPNTMAPLLGIFSGSYTGEYYMSTTNVVAVHFTARGYAYGADIYKFDISLEETNSDWCGGELTRASGTFTSPGYPSRYPGYANCTWRIAVSGSMAVNLTFAYFYTQYSDVVRFYDGPNASSPLIKSFSSTHTREQYISTTNTVTIHFTSDSKYATSGFNISYSETTPFSCGRNLVGSEGSLSSPYYPETYPNNDCEWVITVSENRAVNLKFDIINTYYNHYVYIYDGPTKTYSLLSRRSGTHEGAPILSTSNSVTVYFTPARGHYSRYTGFLISYTETISHSFGCGGNLTNGTGVFGSPGYPRSYSNNMNCIWYITVGDGMVVNMTFDYFNTESCCDRVSVYDESCTNSSSTLLGQYSGTRTGQQLTSTSNCIKVVFRTDGSVTRSGFLISYSEINTMA